MKEGSRELANTRELEGTVAIVTGGNSGIGKAISELFAKEGAKVMIANMQDSGVAEQIASKGGTAMFLKTDVRNLEQVKKLIDQTLAEFGKIDILCNDAGVEQNRPVTETSEEEWDKILDTNLKGVFLTSKFAFPHLTKSKSGAIVNIASQLAEAALPGRADLLCFQGRSRNADQGFGAGVLELWRPGELCFSRAHSNAHVGSH